MDSAFIKTEYVQLCSHYLTVQLDFCTVAKLQQ